MTDYSYANFSSQPAQTQNTFTKSSLANADDESGRIAATIAEAGAERKAGDILILKVVDVSYLADYFVVMTGFSRVQVRAIIDAVEDKVLVDWQRRPLRTEGKSEGSWALLDYGDLIVHVMMPKEREFYNLEAFWGHAERIDFAIADEDE